MSSIPSSLIAAAILRLNTGDKLSEEQEEAFRAFLPTVATAPAPVPATESAAPAPAESAEKPKPKRKVTKAKPVGAEEPAAAEAAAAAAEPINLLLPADEAPAPAPAPAPAAAAPAAAGAFDRTLKSHASRIQVINHAKCMGRRLGDTVAGTTKECGAPKLINHEKQCTSAPKAGEKLCATCAKYEAEKTTKWQGRLDEAELYPKAAVVGSGLFWDKYPNGIASDPTTIPPTAPATAPATALATPVKAKGKKATAPAPGAPKKATAAPAPEAVAEESVADTSAPIAESEWKIEPHEGRQVARNLKTNRVYEVDITKLGSDIKDAIKMDQCIGARQEDGTIDPYGIDSDEE